MRIVWTLAWAQLRHLRGRWALLAAGIALVVAVPVVTSAMSAQVSAQTIRRTIASLDLADRSLLVNQDGGSALRIGSHDQNDVIVRRELARLTAAPVLRELLFRQLTAAGATFYLGAADHLDSSVHLVAGRLPRTCTPQHCETVVLGADTAKLRHGLGQLGVVVVGRAERTNPLLAGGNFQPGRLPVVLGSDVDAMARLAKLLLFGRNYEWVAPVDPARVVALGTGGLRRPRRPDRHPALADGRRHLLRPPRRPAARRPAARGHLHPPVRPARRVRRGAAARVRGGRRDRPAPRGTAAGHRADPTRRDRGAGHGGDGRRGRHRHGRRRGRRPRRGRRGGRRPVGPDRPRPARLGGRMRSRRPSPRWRCSRSRPRSWRSRCCCGPTRRSARCGGCSTCSPSPASAPPSW